MHLRFAMSTYLYIFTVLFLLEAVQAHSKHAVHINANETDIVLERQQALSKYITQGKLDKILNICDLGFLVMLEDGTKNETMSPHDYFKMLIKAKVQKYKINNVSIMRHPWDPRWIVSRGTYEYLFMNGTISRTRMFIHYWSVNSPYYLLYYWQTWFP